MVLKSLEIMGFKSFPDKTKLEFGEGLTAVVGPNGSGKSNISDAVRWVLGEQSTKTLRGDKMEDVIFGGTSLRKPQGFAQVSLTIDNSDRGLAVESDEVTVTRKYYRSGESEYIVNGANVRLKDVNEMFMDTGLGKYGYSMIGQGRIAEIVGAKSSERREIFEEASGISKFRYRKNESERRLKLAEENLLRLKDILSELESRVGPLKTQSEKAQKFLELADQKKVLEISIWIDTLEKSAVKLREQNDKIMVSKADCERSERSLKQLEEKTARVYEQMQKCLVSADELRRSKEQYLSEASEHSSRAAVMSNDIEHHKNEIERINGEISVYSGSNDEIDKVIAQTALKIDDNEKLLNLVEQETDSAEQQLLTLSKEADIHSGKEKSVSDKINLLALESTELNIKISTDKNTVNELLKADDELQKNCELKQAELENVKKQSRELSAAIEELSDKYLSLGNTASGYELKLKSRQDKLNDVTNKYNDTELKIKEKLQKASLLEGLEQNMEGFAYSVKNLIKASEKGMLGGIYGTVSQLITVKKEYSVAVETALGGALQNIVVENESSAKSAISYLKQQKSGRATFLPVTSVKGNKINENLLKDEYGYIALASQLVEADKRYSEIVSFLLGRTAVAEDLDSAVRIARKNAYKFRIVTLDGQIVNAGGSFTGGSQSKNSGILSRKSDVEELRAQADKLKADNTVLMNQIEELKSETASLSAQVTAIKSEMIVVSEDKIRFEGEKKRIDHIYQEISEYIDTAKERSEKDKGRLSALKSDIENLEQLLAKNKQESENLRSELTEISGSLGGLEEKRVSLTDHISELKMKKLEFQKDIDALKNSAQELTDRKSSAFRQAEQLTAKRTQLYEEIDRLNNDISNLSESEAALRVRAENASAEIEKFINKRNELERSTADIRQEQKRQNEQHEGLVKELARMEERKLSMQKETENIVSRLWEEYGVTRSEADELAKPLEDSISAQKDLNRLKSDIKALGNVNVAAIEEYKEVSERFEFLSSQVSDAEHSRDELIKLISDLTQRMTTIFAESFEQINENFRQIFKQLFGGGEGELLLTDGDNILECGIDISVQPPGKKIKNLSSLSGGEQAFVAIAIYFAILKVRPAPFCILDEIEAALDEANVVKYAKYLRNLSDKTQFIMITHRRGSMEEADTLYGVTMQEKGVSKLLKLQISEIESMNLR